VSSSRPLFALFPPCFVDFSSDWLCDVRRVLRLDRSSDLVDVFSVDCSDVVRFRWLATGFSSSDEVRSMLDDDDDDEDDDDDLDILAV